MKGVLDILQSWSADLTDWIGSCRRRPDPSRAATCCRDIVVDDDDESSPPPPPPPETAAFTIAVDDKDSKGPGEPFHIELMADRVFIGLEDLHWSYQGPNPESYLCHWLQGVYGSSSKCCLRIQHGDRVVLRPCFSYLGSNLERFLAVLKDAHPNGPPPPPTATADSR